jgi:hypothetical protein
MILKAHKRTGELKPQIGNVLYSINGSPCFQMTTAQKPVAAKGMLYTLFGFEIFEPHTQSGRGSADRWTAQRKFQDGGNHVAVVIGSPDAD